jgi:hypothetical protein
MERHYAVSIVFVGWCNDGINSVVDFLFFFFTHIRQHQNKSQSRKRNYDDEEAAEGRGEKDVVKAVGIQLINEYDDHISVKKLCGASLYRHRCDIH